MIGSLDFRCPLRLASLEWLLWFWFCDTLLLKTVLWTVDYFFIYSCSNYTTRLTKQNYNITFSRNNCGDYFSTQLHPDMNPHKPELHESFVQVNVVLSLTYISQLVLIHADKIYLYLCRQDLKRFSGNLTKPELRRIFFVTLLHWALESTK